MIPTAASTLDPAGPRGLPLVGHLPDLWRDPLGLFMDGLRRYGDQVRYNFGPYTFLLLNNPDHIRHVLLDNERGYRKSPSYQVLRLILGNGLLTSEGEFWRRQRKLAQPAFHQQALSGFAEAMAGATRDLLDSWEQRQRADRAPFDAHEEMMGLTLRIVGRTLFGIDLGPETDAIGAALTEGIRFLHERSLAILPWPLWVPTPANRRFQKAQATLDRLVYRIIDERRRDPQQEVPPDLLGLYMAARDEGGGAGMSDAQLRDEVMTLVLAGHETTAVALSWTFDLLSRHPEVERRLRQEAQAVLGAGPLTLEALARLEYTGRVLQESMRLYPPAWILDRQALQEDVIGGRRVSAGTIVGISPYTLHRNPALWDNPEGFDPERFLPERSRERPRYAYLPFGAGPRTCIGNAFAMMEAKIILALIIQRYRLELVPGHRPQPEPSVTLRPRHGVHVTLHLT